MMKMVLKISVAMVILSSSGCVNVRHDVSTHRDAWGKYSAETTYFLRQDAFLIRVDSGLEPVRLALVPPSSPDRGSGFYSSPRSITEYTENPVTAVRKDYEHFTSLMQVAGVVRRGTEFIPHHIQRNSGWNVWFGNHTRDTIYGKIVSGKFKGEIVDLSDISWFMENGDALNKYVERRKNTSKADHPTAGVKDQPQQPGTL